MEALEAAPPSEAYREIMEKPSDGAWEAFTRLFTNPSAMWDMGVESLAAYGSSYLNTLLPVVGASAATGASGGAAVGAFTPWGPATAGAGFAAGGIGGVGWGLRLNAGVASAMLEYASDIIHGMEELGLDWHNPNIFEAAWHNNEVRAKLREKAFKKTLPIAVFDALAAGMAGRVSGIGRKITSTGGLTRIGKGVKAGLTPHKGGWKSINAKISTWNRDLQRNTMGERLGNIFKKDY